MTDETLLRLDKWLWYARFCKTRSLAAKLCSSGRIHLDGAIVQKPRSNAQSRTAPDGEAR
jgi:ribosome-associated heat shock protein Hsp15